jgi:DNA repair exonuclease SbcCD nuclease subunit
MIELRGICYSDIHHDVWDNGLTEADLEAIEDQVIEEAANHKAHLLINCGDWTQLRNPPHSIRAKVSDHLKRKAKLNIPTICLIGNHDREVKNAQSGHVLMHVPFFEESLPNVLVLDERRRYDLDPSIYDIPMVVAFHALPAGQSVETVPFIFPDKDKVDFNICLFHDMVKGSLQQNGIPSEHGLDPAILDRPEFDLVLGGDNHRHQDLGFKNTQGYYVGAPCQHNFGDVNNERGIVRFTIFKDGDMRMANIELIPTKAPKFMHVKLVIWNSTDLDNLMPTATGFGLQGKFANNIVQVTLTGDAALLSKVKNSKLETDLLKAWGARRVKVTSDPTIVVREMVPELRDTKSPEDDWKAYIRSGKLELEGCDPDQIIAMGAEVLYESR